MWFYTGTVEERVMLIRATPAGRGRDSINRRSDPASSVVAARYSRPRR
jgi:hypothetical protein